MVICHALTGSSDVEDWYVPTALGNLAPPGLRCRFRCRWGPLLGPGHAFDPTRYFIFCANVLGSPYGTASPTTRNPDRTDLQRWGPEFPATVVRDDVRYVCILAPFLGTSASRLL